MSGCMLQDSSHIRLLDSAEQVMSCYCRRYFTCALKHAQGLAEQVKITANRSKAGCVEMQEQVEMMLLDVFLEGLFEMDLRRVNSEEVRWCAS